MARIGWRGAVVLTAALGLALGACTSGDDSDDVGTSPTSDGEGGGELGTGVTEDSIKVAFTYVDTEAVKEAVGIDIFHGPYDEIMTALVDDLNDNGGINGRTVELIQTPYNPAGSSEGALAACTTATEDEQVFAVVGQAFEPLCIVEQHDTILVGGNPDAASFERARAPWPTWSPTVEHSVQAAVQVLDEEGELEGRTIGIYGLAQDQAALDAAEAALAAAGAEVTFVAVNDADAADRAAIDAQDTTLMQRMEDEGVDALLVAGSNVPSTVLDNLGYYPRLWIGARNIMEVFAGDAYLKFPDVFTVGAPPDQVAFDSEPFQECVKVYEEASGEDVPSPTEAADQGEDSPFIALNNACTALQLFQAAAEAAGDTLNQDTFGEGVESLTEIQLAATGLSSFGPDKFDGQNEFYIYGYNPEYKGRASGTSAVVLRSDDPVELDSP